MRKLLFTVYTSLFIFAFIFLINPHVADAAECKYQPQPLIQGQLTSLKFTNLNLPASMVVMAYISSGTTGPCRDEGSTENKKGCTTGTRTIQNDATSVTFDGNKIGEIVNVKSGIYRTLALCEYKWDVGCEDILCETNNVRVRQPDGSEPAPTDPDDKTYGDPCVITEDSDLALCKDTKFPVGNCGATSGLYCDTVNCEKDAPGNCIDMPVASECDPELCFSKVCKEDGTCDNALVPFACSEDPFIDGGGQYFPDAHSYKFTCNTAIGSISVNPEGFAQSLLKLLLGLAGGLLLILIIINGYKFMTSQGDPEKVKDARDGIIAAIAGILLIIFSLSILQLITADIIGIPGFG